MGDACTRQNRISWIVAYAEALRCLPRRVSLKQQELRFPALALWQQDLYRSPSLCCRCSYSPGGLRRTWPVRALEATLKTVASSRLFIVCSVWGAEGLWISAHFPEIKYSSFGTSDTPQVKAFIFCAPEISNDPCVGLHIRA